jgi:hypothetical protein
MFSGNGYESGVRILLLSKVGDPLKISSTNNLSAKSGFLAIYRIMILFFEITTFNLLGH